MRKFSIVATATLAILMSACQLDPGTNFQNHTDETAPSLIEERASSIVIVDDVTMISDTGDPNVTIDDIEIHDDGGLVASYTGCGQKSCRTDLSSLSPDTYEAIVYTSDGGSFSGYITVG